jgi:hypothetical protein
VTAPARQTRPADLAAGFLATISILGSGLALAYRPVRLIPFAMVLALIAAGMASRDSRLPLIAILVGAVAFVVGLSIAVITKNPVF